MNNFDDFTDLGYLLMNCDTLAICKEATVPDLISTTFPFTEEISYLGTDYVAYSVHEHIWENCSTYIKCEQDGFYGEQCSVCSLIKGDNLTAHDFSIWQKQNATQHKRVCACTVVEYEDHNWNSGVITTPATHLEFGVKTYTCTDCGETKTEDIPKLTAHSFGEWQKHNTTQHKRVCACTAVVYEDHNWNNGVITTPATHLIIGVKTYTCADCGETKTEDIPKLAAHSFGTWQKHNATQHKRVCACTAVVYEDHNWNNGVITTPATHLIIGVKTYTCTDCGETKAEDIPKLTAHSFGEWQKHNTTQHKRACACTAVEYDDHHWDDGTITTQPTCLELGVKTFTCSDCGETKVEDIPKLTEHSYYAWQKHDAIQHKHVCDCSAVEYEEHNWSSGVITKKPTNTEVGVKSFTCIDCGEIKTEEIAKTESNLPSTNSSAGQANSANKDNSSNAKEESLGTGAVIGIVGGSVAVVGGGGFCLYWFVFRKKRLLK